MWLMVLLLLQQDLENNEKEINYLVTIYLKSTFRGVSCPINVL